jgi:hypothetical protein
VTKRERWLIGTVNGSATDERALELRGVTEQLTIRARQRDDICALGDRGLTSQRNARPAETLARAVIAEAGAEADGGAADCRFVGNTGT